MSEINYIEITKTIIYTLGGPVLIIGGLAKLFSDYRIENLKSSHNVELEKVKTQLDQAKSLFLRYSEKQFDLYNDLWRVLNRTRELADSLWKNAERTKLPAFADQIRQTRRAVTDNMLLIEDSDYKALDKLLNELEQFQFGKQKLIEIQSDSITSAASISASESEIKYTISENKKLKERYTRVIMKIGKSFRKQIRG